MLHLDRTGLVGLAEDRVRRVRGEAVARVGGHHLADETAREEGRAERAQAGHDEGETRIAPPELAGHLPGRRRPTAVTHHHQHGVPRRDGPPDGVLEGRHDRSRPARGFSVSPERLHQSRLGRVLPAHMPFLAPPKPDHRVRLAISTTPGTTIHQPWDRRESSVTRRPPPRSPHRRCRPSGRRPQRPRDGSRPGRPTGRASRRAAAKARRRAPTRITSASRPASASCAARASAPCASSSTRRWSPSTSVATTRPG